MKGINKLEINRETLIEALQEYFDKRLVIKPVVTTISSMAHGEWADHNTLNISLQENGDFLNGVKQ